MFIAPKNKSNAADALRVFPHEKKVFLTPGEKITDDPQYMRGHGTFSTDAEPNVMYSTVAGTIEKVNKLVSVQPRKFGRYQAEVGDVVIGRIVEVQQKRWKVDINSTQYANLQLSAVNLPGGAQRRKLESDELQMRTFFKEGDLLVAEVQQVSSDTSVALHTRSLKYRKLRTGFLLQDIPSYLIKRSKNHFIKLPFGVSLIIGVNGMVWICAGELQELTMEMVENNQELLYSDKNDENVTSEQLTVMARIKNCLQLLAQNFVEVNEENLMKLYEVSLVHCQQASTINLNTNSDKIIQQFIEQHNQVLMDTK